MSLVKTNRITNLEDNNQVEFIQGLKVSAGKKLTVLGTLEAGTTGVGTSGQYLQSTATGVRWISLPQNIATTADVTFNKVTTTTDIIVNGSLTVNGTSIGLSNLGIGSNQITLNNDVTTGSPTSDANIIVRRGSSNSTLLKWSEAQQRWQFTNDGVTYYNMLLPNETDFGVATQFGASGDPKVYVVGSTSTITETGGQVKLKVNLQTPSEISKFKSNHSIKIFGATTTVTLPSTLIVSSQSITPSYEQALFASSTTSKSYYAYAFAHYALSNGDMSEAVVFPSAIQNVSSFEMNEANYNSLNITRILGHGVLVYRAEYTGANAQTSANSAISNFNSNKTPFKLVAVLGPKEFPSDVTTTTWQDYGEYDVPSWTNRNGKGEYQTSTIHFPLTPSAIKLRGWTTVKFVSSSNPAITNIQSSDGSFRINLNGLTTVANQPIYVVHDDTPALQSAIQTAADGGQNFLVVSGGTYLIDTLKLPNGFTLLGLADATVFKKQYWSTANISSIPFNGLRNSMIVSSTYNYSNPSGTWALKNTTLSDLVLDGNCSNQILYDSSDLGFDTNNSLVGFPNSEFVSLNNVKIRNASGPAIFAEGSLNFSIESCNIINGMETERYSTDCILLSDSENTKINATIFQNYPGALDITTSQVVSMSGCVVRNCGTGVRIYGSVNTNVKNNLILGPADEYLGIADLYDSDFDGVNLSVKYGVDSETPVYQYIENGVGKDLTSVILRMQVYPVTVSNNIEVVGYNSPVRTNTNGDLFTYVNPTVNLLPADDITIGQIRFRLPSANSTILSTPTPNFYNVYDITGIEYTNIGDGSDINTVLGSGTFATNTYSVVVTNTNAFNAVAVGDYVKLVGHVYSPSTTVDVWKIDGKQTGTSNRLLLKPFSENSQTGDLSALTISGVGTTPTTGGGFIQLRKKFIIAKGIVSVSV